MSVPISKNKMESNLTPGFSMYLHILIHILLVCKYKEEGRQEVRQEGRKLLKWPAGPAQLLKGVFILSSQWKNKLGQCQSSHIYVKK